jgi:hypothetical protein
MFDREEPDFERMLYEAEPKASAPRLTSSKSAKRSMRNTNYATLPQGIF